MAPAVKKTKKTEVEKAKAKQLVQNGPLVEHPDLFYMVSLIVAQELAGGN